MNRGEIREVISAKCGTYGMGSLRRQKLQRPTINLLRSNCAAHFSSRGNGEGTKQDEEEMDVESDPANKGAMVEAVAKGVEAPSTLLRTSRTPKKPLPKASSTHARRTSMVSVMAAEARSFAKLRMTVVGRG